MASCFKKSCQSEKYMYYNQTQSHISMYLNHVASSMASTNFLRKHSMRRIVANVVCSPCDLGRLHTKRGFTADLYLLLPS